MDKILVNNDGKTVELLDFVYTLNGVTAVGVGEDGKIVLCDIRAWKVKDKPARKPGRPKSE